MSGVDTIAGKRILIINDDGIDGAGILSQECMALQLAADVPVVAPCAAMPMHLELAHREVASGPAGIFGQAALSGPVFAGADACI